MEFNYHILWEGENATGKSTLIQELMTEDPSLCFHHFAFPLGDGYEQKIGFQMGQFHLMFDFLDQLGDAGPFFMFDRSHIGEYVWSPIYREYVPEYLQELECTHEGLPIVIINVTADPEVIKARLEERGEATPPVEDLREAQDAISAACDASPFTNFRIDTTDKTIEECKKEILEMLAAHDE
jgi:deoxyadenosine/deoxycytidine kinase